jgi:hypothetical protein
MMITVPPVVGPSPRVPHRTADQPTEQAVDRPVAQDPSGRRGWLRLEPVGDSECDGPSREPSLELVRLLDHLRTTLTRYAGDRRDAGAPVERVIAEVKGLVWQAAALEGWGDPTSALMAQAVRWTISAYYDEPALQHVPRFY